MNALDLFDTPVRIKPKSETNSFGTSLPVSTTSATKSVSLRGPKVRVSLKEQLNQIGSNNGVMEKENDSHIQFMNLYTRTNTDCESDSESENDTNNISGVKS